MKIASQHDVIAACIELRNSGMNKVHVSALHKRMIASGFDAHSSAKALEQAIGNSLMTFRAGYVSTRLESGSKIISRLNLLRSAATTDAGTVAGPRRRA